MNPSDGLATFIEMAALRWKRDRSYREQLMREAKPQIGETLKRLRERKTA